MSEIEHLKQIVANLSTKIETLEAQLKDKVSGITSPAVQVPKSIRMVLIGPPGAGMSRMDKI